MKHYKSWSGLKKQLNEFICEELKNRIAYFLTRYHNVHNSYGRAAILLDGKELVCFSWIEMYHQDSDLDEQWENPDVRDFDNQELKAKWDMNKTYHDMDFLNAVTEFVNIPIDEALKSENYIIRIFAILDRRVGKRKLEEIAMQSAYVSYPDWVKQFYEIRLGCLWQNCK